MVNSVLLVDQYMTHFLKMVQVLSHAVVHPQVCVDPIHNERGPQITFPYSNIGRTIDLYNRNSTDSFILLGRRVLCERGAFYGVSVGYELQPTSDVHWTC